MPQMHDIRENRRKRAVLVSVHTPEVNDHDHDASLAELRRLVTTLGFDVVASLSQRLPNIQPGTIIGRGKLAELARYTGGTGIVQSTVPVKHLRAGPTAEKEEGDDEDGFDDL